ncbi:alpha/beta-hydrolase [Dendrothele bispora CBS 962.96]|uniref:Carboxypeptidase n=1 Tax=Dendrothele bispora (strain CBS 962.96) TaxID=1314807 RepID=A0A4S8KQS5_DENBC|nr:alpha/beta-hydrolase [Dendrothele bispora CBS 962.96]
MLSSRLYLTVLSIALTVLVFNTDLSYGFKMNKKELHARQAEAVQRFKERSVNGEQELEKRATVKNITFSNPKASEFFVDGASIPLVDFDVGPSWSGLLPISADPNETRKLFFWFFPPGPEGSLDDIIFWTNGGPGCSSLEGLLQENGPFSWSWGTAKPIVNDHSWTNLSSILFVEQPVGTGFSQGTPNITDENGVAEQVVGFMQQFLEVFEELKGKKLFITGESYAGMYVPYIANFIFENPDQLDLDLQGIWVSDPVLGWDVVQEQIPAAAFVHKYEALFALDNKTMASIDATAARCNYADYMEKFVTYPPTGLLPLPGTSTEADRGCDIWDMIFNAALAVNPAFNIYRVFDTFPILWDVLGFPGSFPNEQTTPLYFDREDVKKAIHAPVNVSWEECSDINVFPRGDNSLPPSFTVLPNVIEKSNRSVIVHGLADFILIAEGTRIVIQNMTWNGLQGFQTPIQNDSFLVDEMGVPLGTVHSERGLTYYEVALSGHMIPQFSPAAAFQIMQFLMGFRDSP